MYIENSNKASSILINKEGSTLTFKNNGNELSVIRVKQIETGKEFLVFTVKSGTSLSAPIEITLSKLKMLPQLADYGILLSSSQWGLLKKMYIEDYQYIPLFYCYNEIGWQTNPSGVKLFHGSELVQFNARIEYSNANSDNYTSLLNTSDIIEKAERFNKVSESKVILSDSKRHLKKLGSYEESIEFFNDVINGKIIAQVIIATAFASIIVGMLKHNTIILNICGKSSIGKSRISELATSIYSVPNENRITATFDSTGKSLEAFLNNNNGIAVVIDDTSTGYSGEYEWGNLI